ncbi:YdeI/OmpD-associated family protein [Labedaea rhizosphaerae]|uniref:Bacteriocin resistance YdeI/OmpD-like protein n=1 Tax=Labedaea rhizosphaerae TaxID=598644 RepID=A0A4V3CZL7_LABRH|nr:YdeI/OmpD-associated family protein [Labedaea rhizosphaerae]TDQ00161.1 bacteriocin resistance YdeI/OmpD-like protein [Labedaea rhizosphaerae]
MKFTAPLLLNGKTATGFEVPDAVVTSFGAGKRPPVKVTINGYTYRNTIASMGGKHMLGVSAEHRAGAGVAAGDVLEVELELDSAPREVTPPADLLAALDAEPGARQRFEALSYTMRKEHTRSVESAKAEATRLRRVEKIVASLTTTT